MCVCVRCTDQSDREAPCCSHMLPQQTLRSHLCLPSSQLERRGAPVGSAATLFRPLPLLPSPSLSLLHLHQPVLDHKALSVLLILPTHQSHSSAQTEITISSVTGPAAGIISEIYTQVRFTFSGIITPQLISRRHRRSALINLLLSPPLK